MRVNIISRALYDELMRAQQTAEDFQKKYDEAARRMEDLLAAAEEVAKQAAAEAQQGGEPSEDLQKKMDEFAEQVAEAARATREAADEEPLYALDQDLSENLRQLADAMSAAAQQARQGAQADTAQQASEAMEMAQALLGKAQGQYQQEVAEPLDRLMKAYGLMEMQERFIALADKQRDLAERTAELKGRDDPDEPELKARMRDLDDEQRALQEELDTVLQEIRNRAEALPDDDMALAQLKDSALNFADAVETSRARPAQAETARALQDFEGTQANERATEAADVLEGFIVQAQAAARQAQQQGQLAFEPRRSGSAGATMRQLLASAGLGSQAGTGQGVGSGAGGYSMRAGTLDNVGLYGPSPRRGGSGRSDRERNWGGLYAEPAGRSGVGAVTVEPTASGGAEALPLQALPPRHRQGVRAYFRRVAEETSAGTVIDDTEQQPERGTR